MINNLVNMFVDELNDKLKNESIGAAECKRMPEMIGRGFFVIIDDGVSLATFRFEDDGINICQRRRLHTITRSSRTTGDDDLKIEYDDPGLFDILLEEIMLMTSDYNSFPSETFWVEFP